ncbi:glycosyl transferase family 2 [Dysgonomonas alginatilytica]|uniref:Glycosyl transferase family 2 n=1 Tax=Dysgonomonas alginatilytica TaxID=1605892 RepID=A0A2V3PQD6_9BACT|nr:glycosyltransferase family 2 protein [Dysgonomonas alginatilytica]PXV64127.1 glycosyl transferase family 2 [Dysgonomonas alginatilytica]
MSIKYPYTVSVLMPAYNAAEYIGEAIDSILEQTFKNFEFLIIDDGSTDSTADIIEQFNDTRIKLIRNEGNKGLIYSLNYGLDIAQGKYIARMDADDIAFNTRLEKQVEFLENNPDISILGTAFVFMGTSYEIHHPNYNDEIRIKLLDDVVFAHPTVMMRRDVINLNNIRYNADYTYIEDYRFWVEAAIKNVKMANLEEVLLQYRQHPNQVTSQRAQEQLETKQRIKLEYLSHYFGENLTSDELISVNRCFDIDLPSKILILDKLSKTNRRLNLFYKKCFDQYIDIIIYRNVPRDRFISLGELLRVIRNNVSLRFINVLLKINIKKLLR